MRVPRRQRALVAFSGAAQVGASIMMGTVMAVYVGRQGSPFAVGMVLTAYFLASIVFAPVWGAVADITGRRRAVLVGTCGLATLAILPLAFIDGVWLPIGVRGAYGIFAAGFLPVILAIVSERGGTESRGRSIGAFNSARSIGFTGAQFFAGVLLGFLVPSHLYLVIAGVSLAATLAAILIDDPSPTPDTDPTLSNVVGEVRDRLLPAAGEREHLTTHGLQWLYVALGLRNMAWLGMSSLLPIYLIAEIGATEFAMGVLLALAPAGEILLMYAFGRTADTVGRKPLIAFGVAGHGVVALLLAAAVVPASPLVGQTIAGVGMVLKAVTFSAMTAGAIAFIGDVAPVARESELMGLRSTAKGIGGVVGPALIGGLATLFSYELAFVTAGGLVLFGGVLAGVKLVESHPKIGPETHAGTAGDD